MTGKIPCQIAPNDYVEVGTVDGDGYIYLLMEIASSGVTDIALTAESAQALCKQLKEAIECLNED